MSSLGRTEIVAGGLAAASVGLLAYQLTKPTKPKKVRKTGPRKPKYTKKFKRKPLDVNLVMSSDEGFHAYVAADKKNKTIGLKYGSQLTKIDAVRVKDWTHEAIIEKLSKIKVPVTLTFTEDKDLERLWTEAEDMKEKANEFYKQKQWVEAIDLLSQAIERHPTNKVFFSNRVLMYLKTQDYDKALCDCRSIRSLDPCSRYVKGHYLRGLVLMTMEKHKYAASAFQTVLKIQPTFKQATVRLTDCMQKIDELRATARNERRQQAMALMEAAKRREADAEIEKLKKRAILEAKAKADSAEAASASAKEQAAVSKEAVDSQHVDKEQVQEQDSEQLEVEEEAADPKAEEQLEETQPKQEPEHVITSEFAMVAEEAADAMISSAVDAVADAVAEESKEESAGDDEHVEVAGDHVVVETAEVDSGAKAVVEDETVHEEDAVHDEEEEEEEHVAADEHGGNDVIAADEAVREEHAADAVQVLDIDETD